MWLGQMFASRDDAPPEPGNSCEGSPIARAHSGVHKSHAFSERGLLLTPGTVGGGWCAWCNASPSALFHILLMSQRVRARGQPFRGGRVKLHLMNMEDRWAQGTIWSALLEAKQMSLLRGCRISVITVDFPGLKNSISTCWVGPPLHPALAGGLD